jgi:hypothetical protein
MEIGEAVGSFNQITTPKSMCKLKDEPEPQDWQCRIGAANPGDLEKPTAARLNENMKKAGVFTPSDPDKKGGLWDLDKCTGSAFPYQSHHIVPKMHLPGHEVCKWLAKKAKGGKYKLKVSTNYDTDSARNGIALPFASNTYQWKHAKNELEKTQICADLMTKTGGLQLHQGSHTYEDYAEEDGLHSVEGVGYLGAIDKLLNVIDEQTELHVEKCEDCKKSKTEPIEIRPLESVVEAMYQVSGIMEIYIRTYKRFVSERAALHFGFKGTP